jgi:bifunctional ADP-heptose synthase (sugar kinase/adenylyltransferase)
MKLQNPNQLPPAFSILVVGDAMKDIYHIGEATRLSPEAPVPVVKVRSTKKFLGGAANLACNLEELGCEVGCIFQEVLPEKNRLMAGDTQIARWDDDECSAIEGSTLPYDLPAFDAVVISDYKKGAVTLALREALLARFSHHPCVFIDTKGDPEEYSGFANAIFFPNSAEFSQFQDSYWNLPQVCRKEGVEGMSFLEYGEETYYSPAFPTTVRSVNGAGDSAMAGFIYEFLSEGTILECLARRRLSL